MSNFSTLRRATNEQLSEIFEQHFETFTGIFLNSFKRGQVCIANTVIVPDNSHNSKTALPFTVKECQNFSCVNPIKLFNIQMHD